jgi:predicted NBD/HSP70 family sugar kinase
VFASDVATVKRYLKSTKAARSSRATVDMEQVVARALKGQPEAVAALKETARYLGLGLAPIIYGINPEAIVLGGKITSAWPLVEQEIRTACGQRVSGLLLESTQIFPSTLHVRASLMGAIALVLAQTFAAPKTV